MTSEFTSETEAKQSIGWLIVLSIALIIMGILAIFAPVVASAFFTSTMGWIALISGIMMVVQSFRSKPVKGFWLNLIIGIAYSITGL